MFRRYTCLVLVPIVLGATLWAQTPAVPTPASGPIATEKDVQIAHRAGDILATEEAWNQTDHQDCAPTAKTFGIYCALMKAQREVMGSDDHDAAMMDAAREVIDFVAPEAYNARLVNYNNDPKTTFVDIQAFFHILENRLRRQMGSTTAAPAPPAPAGPVTCQFTRKGDQWEGPCGPIADEHPVFSLDPARAITTGAWRLDAKPSGVWSGTITNATPGDAPLELEIYSGGTGVLRTMWGWFPVSGFEADPMRFMVDGVHELAPNDVDRRILERAAALLSSEAVWNRQDTRDCPANAKTWSIYCAVEQGSIELLGAYHHRRPAAELVRDLVDERTKGKSYEHRLMGYNNDPATHLADVQSLFAEAEGRINK